MLACSLYTSPPPLALARSSTLLFFEDGFSCYLLNKIEP